MNNSRYQDIRERSQALSAAIVKGDITAMRDAMPARADDEWAHVVAMGCMIAAVAAIKGTKGTMRSALDLLRGVWGLVKIDYVDRADPS
jgi:hypothetical protein